TACSLLVLSFLVSAGGRVLPSFPTRRSSDVLPERSIVTVSSAFMSSSRARIRRRVSSASGRTWETGSGTRGETRESAVGDRGPFPFVALTARRFTPGTYKIGTRGERFQPPRCSARRARRAVEDRVDLTPCR